MPNELQRTAIHYVYVWFDPRDRSPIYVGKGKGKRAFAPHPENSLLNKICRKLSAIGLKPEIKIIRSYETEMQALKEEARLIANYGRRQSALKTGTLCNLTDGGQGSTGYVFTKEDRIKRAVTSREVNARPGMKTRKAIAVKQSWLNPVIAKQRSIGISKVLNTKAYREYKSKEMCEKWKDPVQRQMRIAAINNAITPDTIRKKSENGKRIMGTKRARKIASKRALERWKDPAHRERVSASATKTWSSKELREANAANTKSYWADPLYKARVSKSIKKALSTPESKANRSRIAKVLMNRPEFRKQSLDAVKRMWADPIRNKEIGRKISEARKRFEARRLLCQVS